MNNRRLWVLKRCEALGLCEDVGVRVESREACERLLRKGSRNFRVDRCTPGPVKIVETAKREERATAPAPATTDEDAPAFSGNRREGCVDARWCDGNRYVRCI